MRRPLLVLFILGSLLMIPVTGSTAPDWSGKPCPDRVHDRYVAEGPEGELWATWHPRIDPIHGCYFQHEHGSDPATVHPDYAPVFGYVATKEFGVAEPHHGYKVISLRGDDLTRWGFLFHGGTHGQGRVCTQHHTLDVAVADYYHVHPARGQALVADVHLLADFGPGQVWDDGTGNTAKIPDATCPGNSDLTWPENDGLRRFANADAGGIGYEVWRTDQSPLPAVGVNYGHLHIAADDPMQICADADCAEMAVKNESFKGVSRWMNTASINGGVLSVENPGTEATFTTNAYGTGPGDVQQYILPGYEWTAQRLDDKCKEVGLPMLLCGQGSNVNFAGTVIDTSLLNAPN